jgi:uncharacterized protein (TIGR00266 family)
MDIQKSEYKYTIKAAPDYAFLNVVIPSSEMLKVEAGSMAYMDTNIKIKAKARGGFKRLISGENLFISEYTAVDNDAEIGIAPASPGDIGHIYLENESIFVQNGSYLASTPGIDTAIAFQGFKGFFSGEKIFMIKCSGTGDLWFNSYGGLIEIDVQESFVVDTGSIVAFTEGLNYTVRPLGGMKSFFFSGEGLVCHFSGNGKIWIQTRLTPAFVQWADLFRPEKKRSNDD